MCVDVENGRFGEYLHAENRRQVQSGHFTCVSEDFPAVLLLAGEAETLTVGSGEHISGEGQCAVCCVQRAVRSVKCTV